MSSQRRFLYHDSENCVGCHSCEVACKVEHSLPVGVNRVRISVEGPTVINGELRLNFRSVRCMHCAQPPCMEVCPTGAIQKRREGIVFIEHSLCNGCQDCAKACPYSAISFHPQDGRAEICDLCIDRLDENLAPFCVKHCMGEALFFGTEEEFKHRTQSKSKPGEAKTRGKSQPGHKVVRTVCQGCMSECGVLVHVRDGKAVKIEGDPDHPLNHGFMCPKGLSYLQTVYHPDRVIYPLKRIGARGEGRFKRVSWDDALDDIAQRLLKVMETYGPEGIAYSMGTYPKNAVLSYTGFLTAIGSPGYCSTNPHVCGSPHFIADRITAETYYTCYMGYPDFNDSRCIVLWGVNPQASEPPVAKEILQARRLGAKLLVIDTRFNELAAKADLWLQPRPATDSALALGMINIICQEELYDKAFGEKWCVGFNELQERAREYPPERVAEITWVPKEKIVEAARLYATIKPATLQSGLGTSMHDNSFQTCRAISILPALTGNLDVKGGNIFNVPYHHLPVLTYMNMRKLLRPPAEVEAKQLGAEDFPLWAGPKSLRGQAHPPSVIKAMLTGQPYPVKALLCTNNLVSVMEDPRTIVEALKKLDLLLVFDFFMTPTAELADYVLPPATYLEREDLEDSWAYSRFVCARPRVIEPVGECRDEDEVIFDLLKRMKIEFPLPVDSNRGLLDYQLREAGVDFEEFCRRGILFGTVTERKYEAGALREDGKSGFNTPSGKVELYSARLKEVYGQDSLPYYKEPTQSPISTPELAKDYPFILITGTRHITSYNSNNHNIPWLRELFPAPTVEVHPDTAVELGIEEGDWVWIETPRGKGRVKHKAHLTLGLHPKVINTLSNWWYPEEEEPDREKRWYEVNPGCLIYIDPPYDPAIGSTLFRGMLCKIYKGTS